MTSRMLERRDLMAKLDRPSLVERIIIGPTEDALVLREAMMALLAEAGVENPGARVFASGIPLRQR